MPKWMKSFCNQSSVSTKVTTELLVSKTITRDWQVDLGHTGEKQNGWCSDSKMNFHGPVFLQQMYFLRLHQNKTFV